jgi:hypothetical protein
LEARQGKLVQLGVLAILLSLFATATAHAQLQPLSQEGTASGRLTVDAVTVPLTHAYASAQPGFFDKNTEDIRIILSDVTLPETARTDIFELIKLAREDRAHIVEVVIDTSGSPISGSIYAKAFDGMLSASGMHQFTRGKMERTIISGRLAVPEPRTFSGKTWQYDAAFSAPIPRPPTAEEVAAAIASPPAQAAMKQLPKDAPPDMRVVGAKTEADGSVLVSVEGHQDGIIIGYTLKMMLVEGAWKVVR